jgi:tRNA G18 (ribose-2'-O)-methylase SpoU
MARRTIASADDPLLDPYRSLKETNLGRDAGGFVAEGRRLFARLIDLKWPLESVLVSDRDVHGETGPLLERLPEDVPVYVVPHEEVRRLIGFKFHRGIMTRARNRPTPTLEEVAISTARIVVASALRDPSNLGSIARSAAAFGWDGLIVGPSTPDAFSRRTLRTSMGAVLRMAVAAVDDDAAAVRRLRTELGFAVYAAEAADGSVPFDRLVVPGRIALVLGNEDEGVPSAMLSECTAIAEIPMTDRVESLNVAAASAILLQRFGSVGGAEKKD